MNRWKNCLPNRGEYKTINALSINLDRKIVLTTIAKQSLTIQS